MVIAVVVVMAVVVLVVLVVLMLAVVVAIVVAVLVTGVVQGVLIVSVVGAARRSNFAVGREEGMANLLIEGGNERLCNMPNVGTSDVEHQQLPAKASVDLQVSRGLAETLVV